ncbi:PAS domain S-box protein [Metabacillus litoralis]|uniref:PAS domain-containing protein n=1 Tax=Metabacillus litoralis TaxID=152268 RepID=UPI001E4A57E6|nr:PAS domain S-box protein [Metabacillus litoralis]UHA60853.1 PAS domain S-box protein [Metabacillus litoralis]
MDLLHAGLERLDQGMALISGDCSIEYANSAFRKLVGLNKEMKKNVSIKDVFSTNSTELSIINKSIKLQQDFSIVFQSVMRNGEKRHLKLETKVLKENAVFKGIMTLYTDITDEVHESEKRANENDHWKIKFETAFDNAGDAMVLMDFRHAIPTFMEANDKMLELVGYTKEEFLQLTVFDLLDPSFHHQAKNIYKKLKNQKNINVKATYVTKNQKMIPVDVTFSKYEVNGQAKLVTVVRNMSFEKEYEQKLLDTLSFYQVLMDSLQVGVTVIEGGKVKTYNRKTLEIFEDYSNVKEGCDDDVKYWLDIVRNKFVEPEKLLDKAFNIIKEKKPIRNWEVKLTNNRYVSLDYTPIKKNSYVTSHVWTSQDITERIQYEQKILEANKIQHKLINSLHEGIILIKTIKLNWYLIIYTVYIHLKKVKT